MKLRQSPSHLSFWTGVASIWNFPGNIRYGAPPKGPNADAEALEEVWRDVGASIWEAMIQFEEETGVRVIENYLLQHPDRSDGVRTTT